LLRYVRAEVLAQMQKSYGLPASQRLQD
jgi:hypothetical protein